MFLFCRGRMFPRLRLREKTVQRNCWRARRGSRAKKHKRHKFRSASADRRGPIASGGGGAGLPRLISQGGSSVSPKRTCGESAGHKGPFFTVTVAATEVGRGTRVPGKERRHYRRVLGTVCRKCLSASIVKVRGRKLLAKKRPIFPTSKVVVSRDENHSPAMGTA